MGIEALSHDLESCLRAHPGDGPARLMRARCEGELPPEGVTRLQEK